VSATLYPRIESIVYTNVV